MKLLLTTLAVSGLALAAAQKDPPMDSANPLLKPSTLALQFPPFDKIKDTHFRPAFEAGMAEQRKEIDAIARDPAPATFENTIVAMEKTGATLTRVQRVFSNLNASFTDDELEKIDTEMSPKLSAHQDEIMLDAALFARVDAVWKDREKLGLDAESLQLLDRYHKQFVRAGAKLSDADKASLKKINERLSSLTTQFRQNVLKATKESAVVVDSKAELDGFSDVQIGAAAEAAKARGLEGKFVLSLQNTTIQPALEHLKNRALRERVYRASISRANGGTADNTVVVAEMVKLRTQQAALLGYPTHAAYQIDEETARTPAAVNKMLGELAPAALAQAKKEAADIQALIDKQEKTPFKVQPWDWAFYEQQVRKARFDFDDSQIKPYFEMNRVMQDGLFYSATQLFGITFKERTDLPVYQPDVRVFEVHEAEGALIGLLVLDYYKRDNKQGGAWMDNYVGQDGLAGDKPVVVNNLNVSKPAAGQPALLTFDEVRGMFHEFGHALHGLFSNVKYPTLSGTNVPRDFVEFPSQYNEMWAHDPAVVAHFAKHYQTGEPIPKALLDKVFAAQNFGTGYATTEILAAAMLDQNWHQVEASKIPSASGIVAFETAALKKDGVEYGPVPPRYRTTYFSHVFGGGYSAAYYAYIWSEVLARDTGHWFHTHGGMSRANGDFLRAKVLSRGRTEEPSVLFEQFYGGPPEIGPLLEYRGLTLPKK